MLNINPHSIIGQSFTVNDPNISYLCIGYGQDPTSAANYVVGECWDQPSNRTKISTFLFKQVTFVGQLPKPVVT
jgi:hypothetical protein